MKRDDASYMHMPEWVETNLKGFAALTIAVETLMTENEVELAIQVADVRSRLWRRFKGWIDEEG